VGVVVKGQPLITGLLIEHRDQLLHQLANAYSFAMNFQLTGFDF
jgi:hypothetical protein